jgi:hypothetical protein
MIQQAVTIERGRLEVRDLRPGGVRCGAARNGLCSAQITGQDGEADRVDSLSVSLDGIRSAASASCTPLTYDSAYPTTYPSA